MAAADLLIVPSYYESLSMVALEAWALGRPVVANAHCDVLLGQCMRSNAGLYYRNAAEFTATLEAIVGDPALAVTLGHNGRAYYERHYDWPVIDEKAWRLDVAGMVAKPFTISLDESRAARLRRALPRTGNQGPSGAIAHESAGEARADRGCRER